MKKHNARALTALLVALCLLLGSVAALAEPEVTVTAGDKEGEVTVDITGMHVLIVEDIVDTGRTLHDVVQLLKTRNPLSMHVITLLDKPSRRVVDFHPDYSLFTIPDQFVIGYGLDCAELYRNLPYIAEYNLNAE